MSVAGTYKTTVKSPMGDQTGTLTVVPDGDTFSGSLIGSLGSMDINGGTVEGNTIKWTMNMAIDGDTLTGSVNAGAFGAMPLSGTREG